MCNRWEETLAPLYDVGGGVGGCLEEVTGGLVEFEG
jgi:hypothetical protein